MHSFCLYYFIVGILACFSIVEGRQKFQFCVVDGRGSYKKAAQYCPTLDGPDSRAECVIGLDRLDCLRRISKRKADFSVFTPEDLVTASNIRVEVLVTNELRFDDSDRYEYEVVAVVNDAADIRNRYDLRDKRFCHPGYGYQTDWTRMLSNYFEVSIVPQTCNSLLSLTENRIRSSSKYFKSACKSGPWVNEPALDRELKQKYPNLCELCDSPSVCSKDDKYWGRRGSLLCLTDGAGDISWARLDDVRLHFGLLSQSAQFASPEGFSYLCPNGTMIPVNSTQAPCIWVAKPWSVIATQRGNAQEIQEFVSSLSHNDSSSWKSALLNLMETYHMDVDTLTSIQSVEGYLATATGFLSANSFPGCHPPRTIRICTSSNRESSKCSWLREAAAAYGVEPDIDCVKADNKTHCMQGVFHNLADLVMVSPDEINVARSEFNLKPLFYETSHDEDKYITVAVVKKSSGIKSFSDLRGKRACFPEYNGIAWNSVLAVLNKASLLMKCPFNEGIAEFFDVSCVPNLPNTASNTLRSICKGEIYDGDYGAMRCLTHENGDVAFVSNNTFVTFFKDLKQKGNIELDYDNYEILCQDSGNPCHLSWAPPGQAMIRGNSSSLWIKDSVDVFLQMNSLFGKDYKTSRNSFTLFGLFDGKEDVLFHDATMTLREVPILRDTDDMKAHYDDILNNMHECITGGSTNMVPTFCIYFLLFTFLCYSNFKNIM